MTWSAQIRGHLDDFVLDVELEVPGGVLAIVGPNGCGKTTLFRALVGALELELAEIVVSGVVLESTRQGRRLPMEQRGIGYVPQGYGLFPHLSAGENVAFGLSTGTGRRSRQVRKAKARSLLRELGCEALYERRVTELSGGEQQRVALARALVIEPRMLLLDEPLSALDIRTRRAVRSFLSGRLASFDGPSVIATHDVRDVAALGATLCVLDQGRVVQLGSLPELRSQPVNDFVAEFVALQV